MDPIDLSSLVLSPSSPSPSPRESKTKASISIHNGISHRERNRTRKILEGHIFDEPESSSVHRKSPAPKLGCPFHKYDPEKFSSFEYMSCSVPIYASVSHLLSHINARHIDHVVCPECGGGFDYYPDFQTHKKSGLCGCDPNPRFHKAITTTTLAELHKLRDFQKGRTAEEEWYDMYRHLFPNEKYAPSPYLRSSIDQSEHVIESTVSYGPHGIGPLVKTAPTIASKLGSEAQSTWAAEVTVRRRWANSDIIRKIEQDQRNKEYMEYMDLDEELGQQMLRDEEHKECIESLECGRHESQDRSLEEHKTPSPKDDSPYCRETRSPAVLSPSTSDNFGTELSPPNSRDSLSTTSEQSTELYEEDETHVSDSDVTVPVRQALFDDLARQFWTFYNGLSASDWLDLWSQHKTWKGAASSSQGTQRSARTSSDTRTPSDGSPNSTPLLTSKRKKIDDDDGSNSNQNPSKRSNRTSTQKEGLNLACPFHKYKPWKYNHGILRFRTCSTTPFDAIFRLKEHLRRVHPSLPHCTRCWQTFADQNSLVNHSQADIPCKRKQPVPVEGWTTEMDKKITKRKDETERERWERIYRALFGKSLMNVPSPYFVPYDLATAGDADLETLLHQEVPRIVLNSMREEVNNMDMPDAARALFDPTIPYFQLENFIGIAIKEVFTTYRSATATANNPEVPLTPQSSSENRSIVEESSAAQSATCENAHTDSMENSRDQLRESESLPPVAAPEIRNEWDAMRPGATGRGSYQQRVREQVPLSAAESASHVSETASNSFLQNPSSLQQCTEEYMSQGGHHDMTNAYGANMDEYMFVNFDLEGGFNDEAFQDLSTGPSSAPIFP